MSILDIFSKRQSRMRGELPDVFQYEDLPEMLRIQIAHIIRDALGSWELAKRAYATIHNSLCREYGLFSLSQRARQRGHIEPQQDVIDFMMQEKDVERVLDVVEVSFKMILVAHKDRQFRSHAHPSMTADEAVDELNARFKEHAVGYQFEAGEIIRVDSQIVHESAVRPALHLLRDSRYSGANEEFLAAHEHYRHGRNKECLNDCLKALESTLKSICRIRKWEFQEGDTARKLINICFKNELVPSLLQTQFSSLQQNLESGIPAIRNKLGGHGQGPDRSIVPAHFAAFQLHMTASAILFLAECEKGMP